MSARLRLPERYADPLPPPGAKSTHAGQLVDGHDLNPDVAAAQVATCARTRNWPVLAAQAARLRVIDPELTVETLPGRP